MSSDQPRRSSRNQHRWGIPVERVNRALWSCVKCPLQVETAISHRSPSDAREGRFYRIGSGPWSPLRGPLPICPAVSEAASDDQAVVVERP